MAEKIYDCLHNLVGNLLQICICFLCKYLTEPNQLQYLYIIR